MNKGPGRTPGPFSFALVLCSLPVRPGWPSGAREESWQAAIGWPIATRVFQDSAKAEVPTRANLAQRQEAQQRQESDLAMVIRKCGDRECSLHVISLSAVF